MTEKCILFGENEEQWSTKACFCPCKSLRSHEISMKSQITYTFVSEEFCVNSYTEGWKTFGKKTHSQILKLNNSGILQSPGTRGQAMLHGCGWCDPQKGKCLTRITCWRGLINFSGMSPLSGASFPLCRTTPYFHPQIPPEYLQTIYGTPLLHNGWKWLI